MKSIIAALCVVALLVNAFAYYFSGEIEWIENSNRKVKINNLVVRVPEKYIHDAAVFDHSVFVQLYWHNKSTDEWVRYTLVINGQWSEAIPGISDSKDGYGEVHTTLHTVRNVNSQFSLTLEKNDSEPATVFGSVEIDHEEFIDLKTRDVVKNINNASVSVTGIPSLPDLPIPSGGLTYSGSMISFPDPTADSTETLEEAIFGRGQTLRVGDGGELNYTQGNESWQQEVYHWKVEEGVMQSGYKCLRVNITATFFDNFMPFNQQIWVSNEASYPVKSTLWTNMSWSNEWEEGYTYSKTAKTMHTNGFYRGDANPPWGLCVSKYHYRSAHPLAERTHWKDNLMPADGDISTSSFEVKSEDAFNYAKEHSEGLKEFFSTYNHDGRVIIEYAEYSVYKDDTDKLDPQQLAGNYTWNFSVVYCPTKEERDAAHDHYEETGERPYWQYQIAVTKEVERRLVGYVNTTTISYEMLSNKSWGGDYTLDELNDLSVTLASSEKVLRNFPEVMENLHTDPNTGKLVFGENDRYGYAVTGIESNDMVLTMIERITGLTTPSSVRSWYIQQGTIWEDGETVSAGVDVDTGRMLYLLKASGIPLGPLLENL